MMRRPTASARVYGSPRLVRPLRWAQAGAAPEAAYTPRCAARSPATTG